VSNGGSSLIYVVGHDEGVIAQVVRFLRRWEFTGAVLTRQPLRGTFALSQVHLDSGAAPDVVVSMRWTTEKNQAGTPGMVAADVPGLAAGQGAHVSLSPFDLHNTMVAAGPDFRSGVVDTLASGNVDVAPTVLWILGLKPPKPMDGRVLTEALTIARPRIKSFEPSHIETSCEQEGVAWHQYLNFTEVNGWFITTKATVISRADDIAWMGARAANYCRFISRNGSITIYCLTACGGGRTAGCSWPEGSPTCWCRHR